MTHRHAATSETRAHLYEVCACGAVRKLTSGQYDQWHACDLCAQADTEYTSRIDAQRVTLELAQRSTRRVDAGRESIEDSPLFGGTRQQDLFGDTR